LVVDSQNSNLQKVTNNTIKVGNSMRATGSQVSLAPRIIPINPWFLKDKDFISPLHDSGIEAFRCIKTNVVIDPQARLWNLNEYM
jgi:hypothetical protein